jgi:outer membrane protein TolC
LGVATAVTDASLAVLADEQRVKASQADVDRRTVFARSVHALVDAHLRPGADASRADAELAAAKTQLILAQENLQVASAALAEVLGIAGAHVEIKPGPFLQIPPENIWHETSVANHPQALVEQRRIEEVQSRINVLNHSYYPHFTLEGLTSARGSGEDSKGFVAPGLNGLGADVHNWEAGLTVSLPLLDFISIHERRRIELANRRREQALYEQTIQNLSGQLERAKATIEGARRVAQNTPIELQASRDSEAQARARFQAGVGTIVDVAEAQRLLVQAEIDDSLARLSIWRALADLAAAEGDIRPFLDLANSLATGAP